MRAEPDGDFVEYIEFEKMERENVHRGLILATLCDMVLGEDAEDRSDEALMRATRMLLSNTACSQPRDGSTIIYVSGLTAELREVLMGANKWLRRIHERKEMLPASFLDNCDPKPLADHISRILSNTEVSD